MKNLTMETVADMAGVRAKETDKVSIELTKSEANILGLILLGAMSGCDNNKTNREIGQLRDKILKTNLEWSF